MSYPLNYPTPQNANVQIFHSNSGSSSGENQTATWIKPQGASFVWFTLIGPGGSGDAAGTSGGSGGVTNFMCPAFLIPDSLQVLAANPDSGSDTKIFYITTNASTPTVILRGVSSSGTSGGSAMTSNFFTAMGFFQSVAGQNGSTVGVVASSTTFLSAGAVAGTTVTANYGYTNTTNNRRGYFMLQPIIVGVGGIGTASGGIGCGGGDTGKGGNGMVVIITW